MRSTSSPRAATSVATSTSSSPSFNRWIVRSRCFCSMSPLIAAAARPRACSFSASSSVPALVRANTIMASYGSASRMRVSASSLCRPLTNQ
jgi:hypothetical protein